LTHLLSQAEEDFRTQVFAPVLDEFALAADALFASKTQSFREVALGCALVRLLDKKIDIHLPYVNQGAAAFNGRTLDEKVINPFLHEHQIPASKGPYLATFRRSVRFDETTRSGMRDKAGYDAFLIVLQQLAAEKDDDNIRRCIRFLLYRFVALRQASQVLVARINRLSLEQLDSITTQLLSHPSGGLTPLLIVVAMLQTLRQCYELDWVVRWQGINVSDKASGVAGDIIITHGDRVRMAFEVTERVIDRARVVSTFNTKISPSALEDYVFIFTVSAPTAEARQFAAQLFGQGHDVNFVELHGWLHNNLINVGASCRKIFLANLLELLSQPDVPATIKVKWNELVKDLMA